MDQILHRDVDNMWTGCFGIKCPSVFFLKGLHYVLCESFEHHPNLGIKMMDVFNLFVAMSKWNIIHKACRWSLPSRNHLLRIQSSHLFFWKLHPSLTPPDFDNVEVLRSGEAFLILGGSMLIHSWWEWLMRVMLQKLTWEVSCDCRCQDILVWFGEICVSFVQKGSNFHRLEVSIHFSGWCFCSKGLKPCDVVLFFKQMWLFLLLAFDNLRKEKSKSIEGSRQCAWWT